MSRKTTNCTMAVKLARPLFYCLRIPPSLKFVALIIPQQILVGESIINEFGSSCTGRSAVTIYGLTESERDKQDQPLIDGWRMKR
jgi:hypothetical protein